MNKFNRQIAGLLLTVVPFSESIASDEFRNLEFYECKAPLCMSAAPESSNHLDDLRNFLNQCIELNRNVKIKLWGFSPQNIDGFFEIINSCEASKSHIAGLEIFCAQLDDEKIIKVVDNLPYLQTLKCSHNDITALGAAKIVGLPDLKVLDISSNWMGNLGAAEIAKSSTLEVLNISINSITDEGVSYFFHGMPNLRELNLGNNKITYEGAKKLIDSSLFDHLHKLSLSYNQISTDQAKELSEQALEKNPKVMFSIDLKKPIDTSRTARRDHKEITLHFPGYRFK